MITVAICDDEKIIVYEMRKIIEEYYQRIKISDYEIKCFLSGDSFLESHCDFDILFLDIDMPGMDGIEVGKQLLSMNEHGKIIMLTSLVERFKEAFEIEAYRFITKPIVSDEVYSVLDDVSRFFAQSSEVELERYGKIFRIKCRDILYLESFNGITEIYLSKEVFKSKQSLLEWENKLDSNLFFRCHKKNIVNISHISEVADDIVLKTGEHIEYSRRKKKELMDRLLQYDLNGRG